ncbi:shikimate kinase [Cellulophaga sp. Hel_I_12]|uniref:shikimate kinase n=1 Tax=Cellulophaga sp. Hel_I_12 TaxID=1249972 RepID=UPI000646A9E9|nr:shikimate kinase [Cellulophaga sp. Hel_I_12]
MKIVLVGYMGSGKSTIGRLLSKKLKINFIDLDDYLVSKLKMPISELFEVKGELFFRKKEREYLQELMLKKTSFILATGGGTPCYGDNLRIIQEGTTHDFYLKLSIPSLVQRLLSEKENRPILKNIANDALPEFIGKHLFERNNYYLKANHIIPCDGLHPEALVEEIIRRLE